MLSLKKIKKHNYCLTIDSSIQVRGLLCRIFFRFLTWIKKGNYILLNINTYVWRSIKNNSINYTSRNKKIETLDEKCLTITLAQEPLIEETNKAYILHESINNLPIGCKSILELYAFDGHTYNSAANHLGISINTVKTQIKKAYKILRHDLKNDYLFLILLLKNSLSHLF